MPFSRRQLWMILLIETVFFAALAAWVLVRLDRFFEPLSLAVALAIILIGDLVTVVLMQQYSPTRITFAAGEARLLGEAVDGFGDDERGRVLIRGEQWAARRHGSQPIQPGDQIRVLSRGGLTLLVEPAD